jgi:hypothetical protein
MAILSKKVLVVVGLGTLRRGDVYNSRPMRVSDFRLTRGPTGWTARAE